MTGSFRSTFGSNLVNDARFAYSGAPVYFNPNVIRDIWDSQNGYHLGDQRRRHHELWSDPDANRERRLHLHLHQHPQLAQGRSQPQHGRGVRRGTTCGWERTARAASRQITFGTPTGDPALGDVLGRELPWQQPTRSANAAAALYAVLVGRVTQIAGDRPSRPAHRSSTSTRETAGPRGGCSRSTSSCRTTGASVRTSRLTPVSATRCSRRFYALNNSYSIPTLDDVWGISGYVPGCDPSAVTPATCNLFKPGVTPGRTPQFQNLGKGREGLRDRLGQHCAEPSASTGRRARTPGFLANNAGQAR